MRQDYGGFTERQTEILVIGPDGPRSFQRTWDKEGFPFVGLADPRHTVAHLYGQEVNLLKLGRMPAVVVVDKAGRVVYRHYGDSMSDIPDNQTLWTVLDALDDQDISEASR